MSKVDVWLDGWPESTEWQGSRRTDFAVGDRISMDYSGRTWSMIVTAVAEDSPGVKSVTLRHADDAQ